ncbi:MAG TPA: 2-phosphosulfolactate phosphatase, partial [Flavobacteriales bacterium]|nr:2-phosphosulfolactate phosphatase [Flavobacteriales bacterium]
MKAVSSNADYKFRVETCFVPGQFPLYEQDAGIVVTIDILRATSAMVTAFECGVERIIPVSTVEEAQQYIGRPGFIAAAERNGEVVDGFAVGNSPLAFKAMDLKGKTIVMTTTNGTRAINLARNARQLVVGSFINLSALTEWLLAQNDNILLLCSGWKEKFSLEDSVFAGAVMDRLLESGKFGVEEDSSIASKYLYMAARDNFMSILKAAPRRKRLEKLNLLEDVKYCL